MEYCNKRADQVDGVLELQQVVMPPLLRRIEYIMMMRTTKATRLD